MNVVFVHSIHRWKVIDGPRVYYVTPDRTRIESLTHGQLSPHGRTAKRVLAALPDTRDELAAARRRKGRR